HPHLPSFPTRRSSDLVPKIKIGAKLLGVGEAGAEIDLAGLKGPPRSDVLLVMDQLLGTLARKRKPTVLMLDEVQELAVEAANRRSEEHTSELQSPCNL